MTLSNYNSNENADFNSGEMILSNYDFNETANYEPSESEDIYILIPDITSMICDHIITKFYYRKYMLKKKNVFPKNFCNSSDFRIVVQLLYNSRIVGELMYTCCVGLESL